MMFTEMMRMQMISGQRQRRKTIKKYQKDVSKNMT